MITALPGNIILLYNTLNIVCFLLHSADPVFASQEPLGTAPSGTGGCSVHAAVTGVP